MTSAGLPPNSSKALYFLLSLILRNLPCILEESLLIGKGKLKDKKFLNLMLAIPQNIRFCLVYQKQKKSKGDHILR